MPFIKKIIVDNRELKNKVCKHLYLKGYELQAEQLEIGDYVISQEIVIERKNVKDFLESLLNGRLFKQLIDLKNNYKKPILLLEEYSELFRTRNIHKNAIMSAISTILLKLEIPIIYTEDEEDSCDHIISLFEKHYSPSNKKIQLRHDKKIMNGNELLEYITSGIPLIGREHAKTLLQKYKTIRNISNTTIEDLQTLPGIGSKKGAEIIKTLNLEYEI